MLEEARRLRFIGPGPVGVHLDHAAGFVAAVRMGWPDGADLATAVELGSGGGVPGLPLALAFPATAWTLVEANRRRAAFLDDAVVRLGLGPRVKVAHRRAEDLARTGGARAGFQLAVARGFGPPPATAECAAPLLAVNGRAVISEPPDATGARWPRGGLEMVGMRPGPLVQAKGARYQVLVQAALCGERFPRRTGVPVKRPLF